MVQKVYRKQEHWHIWPTTCFDVGQHRDKKLPNTSKRKAGYSKTSMEKEKVGCTLCPSSMYVQLLVEVGLSYKVEC